MKKILRNNGLSLVLFLCFAAFLVGQSLTGGVIVDAPHGETASG